MSVFCFANADGEVVERHYPMGQCPKRIQIRGVRYKRSREDEWNESSAQSGDPWAGHRSTALGVHPDQVKQAEKFHFDNGVPTKFDSNGEAIITSSKHQQDVCRLRGFFNKDANWSPENA